MLSFLRIPILSVIVLRLLFVPLPALAQAGVVDIDGIGEICSAGQCYPFAMKIPPAGGPVEGHVEGSSSYVIEELGVTIGSSFIGRFTGGFEGGDGGEIGGEWEIVSTVKLPADLPPNAQFPTTIVSGGSWGGTLGAEGSGSGTYQGSDSLGMPVSGTWSSRI